MGGEEEVRSVPAEKENDQSLFGPGNKIVCVCGHCGNHDNNNVIMEFNFFEQRVLYLCSNCKKMNVMKFGQQKLPPLPRTRVGIG